MKFKVTCFRLDFNPSFCISCTGVWNLLHYTFIFLALYFCISCTKFRFFIVNACKMKHWKQKWNIQRVCFILWNAYKSIVFVQKVKHWNMRSRTICVIINSSFGFSKGGLKAQWSTQPRASEATPWVSRVGAVAPCKVGCSKLASKTRPLFRLFWVFWYVW